MELWTALALGFLGSFHCVSMCGPLVLGLPRASSRLSDISINAVIYNSGRILVYSLFGLIFGFFGNKIALAGFQSILSIMLGSAIIIGVLFLKKSHSFKKPAIVQKFISKINTSYGVLIRKNSKSSLFGLGALNGLLPCAFVYSGLAAAVLTKTPYHSMLYMALFGLGTMPALFTIYLSPNFISLSLRSKIKTYIPYMALSLGVFLIFRGIILQNIGLPTALIETMEPFCVFPGTNT
ncbi:MAG: sulfite exporter TauE/SafE family protein [Balneola sp.]